MRAGEDSVLPLFHSTRQPIGESMTLAQSDVERASRRVTVRSTWAASITFGLFWTDCRQPECMVRRLVASEK